VRHFVTIAKSSWVARPARTPSCRAQLPTRRATSILNFPRKARDLSHSITTVAGESRRFQFVRRRTNLHGSLHSLETSCLPDRRSTRFSTGGVLAGTGWGENTEPLRPLLGPLGRPNRRAVSRKLTHQRHTTSFSFGPSAQEENMSLIVMLIVGFGLGCVSGIVLHVLSRNQFMSDSERAAILDRACTQIAQDGSSHSAWLTVASHAAAHSENANIPRR